MSSDHKSTRIGDLLVERGTITRHQLLFALKTQQERQLQNQNVEYCAANNKELGEILIELRLINRKQLESSLTWQSKLRSTTFMVAFIAPLLTAACGTNLHSVNTLNRVDTRAHSWTYSSNLLNNSRSQRSRINNNRKSLSAPAGITSSAASQSGLVDGPVAVYWCVPALRENGEQLSLNDIAGYELRYKSCNESEFKTIRIENGFTDAYYFDHLQGEFEFQIATIDINGLYSKFVPINQHYYSAPR